MRLHTEHGNSPVTAIAGLAIFLAFLLLAAQTAIHLYATSTSTSVLFDEARRVAASAGTGTYPCSTATASVRARLGDWGSQLIVSCSGDADPDATTITLTARGQSPVNLLASFGDLSGLATFERSATATREVFRR